MLNYILPFLLSFEVLIGFVPHSDTDLVVVWCIINNIVTFWPVFVPCLLLFGLHHSTTLTSHSSPCSSALRLHGCAMPGVYGGQGDGVGDVDLLHQVVDFVVYMNTLLQVCGYNTGFAGLRDS